MKHTTTKIETATDAADALNRCRTLRTRDLKIALNQASAMRPEVAPAYRAALAERRHTTKEQRKAR